MESIYHVSVLLNETVQQLIGDPSGTYVDCTLGGGGHSAAIADKLSSDGRLIAIDQDPDAIQAGKQALANCKCRLDIVNSNFSKLAQVLDDLGIDNVDGIMFDLGVSSYQLDTPDRGFSYMQDGPLDMRMDPNNEITAYEVVNKYSEQELAKLIFQYGEERWAKRIAAFIVRRRKINPLSTTSELVNIIKDAIPAAARRSGPHPAKRTFQAIRIEVNQELNILADTIVSAVKKLKNNGKLCVITFHSLEDRIVKKTLHELATGCICPPSLPICVCNHQPLVKIVRPIEPTQQEVDRNSRARSAKLRVAIKM